jgi:hypothetical protein
MRPLFGRTSSLSMALGLWNNDFVLHRAGLQLRLALDWWRSSINEVRGRHHSGSQVSGWPSRCSLNSLVPVILDYAFVLCVSGLRTPPTPDA